MSVFINATDEINITSSLQSNNNQEIVGLFCKVYPSEAFQNGHDLSKEVMALSDAESVRMDQYLSGRGVMEESVQCEAMARPFYSFYLNEEKVSLIYFSDGSSFYLPVLLLSFFLICFLFSVNFL